MAIALRGQQCHGFPVTEAGPPLGRSEKLNVAVAGLLEVGSWNDFSAWLSSHTAAERQEVLRALGEDCERVDTGVVFENWHELLSAAEAGDPQGAWRRFEDQVRGEEEIRKEVEAEFEAIQDQIGAGEYEQALVMIEGTLVRARETRILGLIGALLSVRAVVVRARAGGERGENLEAAIADLNEAIKYVGNPAQAARTMQSLALAYGDRVRGDRIGNLAIASELLREALGQLSEGEPADLYGELQAQRAEALLRREDGDRVSQIHEALALADASLADLDFEAHPIEWARRKIILAGALVSLLRLEGKPTRGGEDIYEEVIARGQELANPRLLATAQSELGRIKRAGALRSNKVIAEALLAGEKEAETAESSQRANDEALGHLQVALAGFTDVGDDLERALALGDMALIHRELHEVEAAIRCGREALTELSVERAPRMVFEVSFALATIYAEFGDWILAAPYFRDAVAAGELLFHTRRDDVRREAETVNFGELGRWAALALWRVGELEEALEVLENGRTRELRRRLGLGPSDIARPDRSHRACGRSMKRRR